ncbi:hypothetical protein [Mucilaginibacter sp.]
MKKLLLVFLCIFLGVTTAVAQAVKHPASVDSIKITLSSQPLFPLRTGHQVYHFSSFLPALGYFTSHRPKDTSYIAKQKIKAPISAAKSRVSTPATVKGFSAANDLGLPALPAAGNVLPSTLLSHPTASLPLSLLPSGLTNNLSTKTSTNTFNLPALPAAANLTGTLPTLPSNPVSGNAAPVTTVTAGVSGVKNSVQQTLNSTITGNPAIQSGASLIKNASLNNVTNGISNPLSNSKLASTQFLALNNSLNQNFKNMQHPNLGLGLTLENDFQYQPMLVLGNNVEKFENVVGVQGNITLFGVPLSLNLSNNKATFNSQTPFSSNLFKVGFSPQSLSGLMQNPLQQYAGLKNSVFHGFDFTEYVHQTLNEQVHSLDNSTSGLKNTALSGYLSDPDKLQQLIQLDDAKLKEKMEALAAQKNGSGGLSAGDSTALAAKNKATADSLAKVITGIKSQLSQNGVDPNKVMLEENYLSGKTSSTFNSSEAAGALSDKNSQGGLQSFFNNVKAFQIGAFGSQLPGATDSQGKLLSGGNLTIKADDVPLTFGFGKVNDINSLKDASYTSSVYTYTQDVTYIGAQLHQSVLGNVNVSLVSSFSGQSNNTQYSDPVLPGNSVAFTLTKNVKMGSLGNLDINVSKSSTLFENNYELGSEAILAQKAGENTSLNNNLFQSLSVGFNHSMNIQPLNASENVYFTYSGLGYQNPSNNGYTGNTIKGGGDLKKKLLRNKLTLDFRTDIDITPMSYTLNDKWKNYQVQLDSRYQVNNHFNLSLKYLGSGTGEDLGGVSTSVYSSQKLELDANDSYKLGRFYSTSALSVGDQVLSDSYISQSQSSLLNVNYVQTVIFKTSSLTGTVFYNKELANYQLIGDMLTSDISYQYTLFKKFQLSSGVTYLNNVSIAKQIGVKQSLQLLSVKSYELSASVDLNKNLMTPEYADLYAQCRAELSFKYHFKVN